MVRPAGPQAKPAVRQSGPQQAGRAAGYDTKKYTAFVNGSCANEGEYDTINQVLYFTGKGNASS